MEKKIIYLIEKEIKDLCDRGFIYEVKKGMFRFLENDECDNIVFKVLKGGRDE